MADTIDPTRLDLAAEYKARPFGRHSPELQALLNIIRRAENCQDLMLVSIAPNKWVLATRLPDGAPPALDLSQVFDRLEDGEWEAFKRRWKAMTGNELVLS